MHHRTTSSKADPPQSAKRSETNDSSRGPKVVRIIGRLSVGGPAHQIALLHQALEPDFQTVLITGSLYDGETSAENLLHSQERLHRVPSMRRPISPLRDLIALARITAVLRRERPDIVHTHCSKAGALGRVAAVLAGVPVRIHTYHGHIFDQHFGWLQSRIFLGIERLLAGFTTRAIALSESQAKALTTKYGVLPREKVSIIRNGFDLGQHATCERREEVRRSLGITDQCLVVWAGRLVPIKNLDLLAEIIQAAQANRKLHFAVVGDGTERPRMQSLLAGCRNVSFLGWQTDMAAIWSAADIALLTSRNEGTPTALIEAMAAGKPFVATKVGGVVDLVLPPVARVNGNGILKARNAFLTVPYPGDLLACLQRLASDHELACRMGAAGQQFVMREYAAERLVRDMSRLYRELCHRSMATDTTALSTVH